MLTLTDLKNKTVVLIIFFLIISVASVVRLYQPFMAEWLQEGCMACQPYKIDQIPPSLTWDEAAVGYNAYAIANFGKDEWGRAFPFYFKSFEDDKHPIHIYFTALSVKLLGLNEFSTRLPAAIFGILSVIVIFYLTRILFNNNLASLFVAFLLTISPMAIHFSRFNHEFNFALLFFLLGLYLFFLSLKRRKARWLAISVTSFGVSFLSYHAAIVVVPPILILLFAFYFPKLWTLKRSLISSAVVMLLLGMIVFLNPELLGFARIQQSSIDLSHLNETRLYKLTNNPILGRGELVWDQYILHFQPTFLFISGDKNPRLSSQGAGEFYWLQLPLIVLGIVYLVLLRSRIALILLAWLVLSALPSSLAAEAPHSARSLFMAGSFNLISGIGLIWFISLLRYIPLQLFTSIVVAVLFLFYFKLYLMDYFTHFPKQYAIEYQYGMKQVVEYVKKSPEFSNIYQTAERSQPYAFYLFYLHTSLDTFQKTAKYNTEKSRSFNLVTEFDKYHFGGDWDPLHSPPTQGNLYVLTPSEYDGLYDKKRFVPMEIVNYPNGTTAFYLVTAF
jgi:hypothetical protein